MGNQPKWTKPYCGVQHLNGLPRGWQITVTDYGSFAEAWVLAPGHGFTPVAETSAADAAAARVWCEAQGQLLAGKAA